MLAKYILAVVGAVFLVLALGRIARDGGRIGPASRTWLIIAIVFAVVSVSLFTRRAWLTARTRAVAVGRS